MLASQANRSLGVVLVLVLAVTLALSLRWRLGWLVIGVLAVAGVAMRLDLLHAGTSDVLTVTRSAIETTLAGGSPYGIGYASSSPPGAPFPYGPLALLWYLPFRADPRVVELAVSLLVLAVLALRGRPIGLAIYALALPLLLTASDGSNDTSGGDRPPDRLGRRALADPGARRIGPPDHAPRRALRTAPGNGRMPGSRTAPRPDQLEAATARPAWRCIT